MIILVTNKRKFRKISHTQNYVIRVLNLRSKIQNSICHIFLKNLYTEKYIGCLRVVKIWVVFLYYPMF